MGTSGGQGRGQGPTQTGEHHAASDRPREQTLQLFALQLEPRQDPLPKGTQALRRKGPLDQGQPSLLGENSILPTCRHSVSEPSAPPLGAGVCLQLSHPQAQALLSLPPAPRTAV